MYITFASVLICNVMWAFARILRLPFHGIFVLLNTSALHETLDALTQQHHMPLNENCLQINRPFFAHWTICIYLHQQQQLLNFNFYVQYPINYSFSFLVSLICGINDVIEWVSLSKYIRAVTVLLFLHMKLFVVSVWQWGLNFSPHVHKCTYYVLFSLISLLL